MARSYEALLKDRAIIAAEVLHEYDEKVSAQLLLFACAVWLRFYRRSL